MDELTNLGCCLLRLRLSLAGCPSACGLASLVVPTVSLTRDGAPVPPGLADLGSSESQCGGLDVGGYGTCVVSTVRASSRLSSPPRPLRVLIVEYLKYMFSPYLPQRVIWICIGYPIRVQ